VDSSLFLHGLFVGYATPKPYHIITIPLAPNPGTTSVAAGPLWSARTTGEIDPSRAADQNGMHSVIIQAVHFVDLETGATALNQSR
jgi:hypothetical protein